MPAALGITSLIDPNLLCTSDLRLHGNCHLFVPRIAVYHTSGKSPLLSSSVCLFLVSACLLVYCLTRSLTHSLVLPLRFSAETRSRTIQEDRRQAWRKRLCLSPVCGELDVFFFGLCPSTNATLSPSAARPLFIALLSVPPLFFIVASRPV